MCVSDAGRIRLRNVFVSCKDASLRAVTPLHRDKSIDSMADPDKNAFPMCVSDAGRITLRNVFVSYRNASLMVLSPLHRDKSIASMADPATKTPFQCVSATRGE
jgi:hypothetical protein